MPNVISSPVLDRIREHSIHLDRPSPNYDALMQRIGSARYVLLGEASHGTHEFYRARGEITKRLVLEKGFNVIAWEADWPDAMRVHRFLQGAVEDGSALESLKGFERFPVWMWRNADVLDLVGWLRSHNDRLSTSVPKVGVYGLDLYSLHSSIQAVIGFLEQRDPQAAREARRRYSCFEDFGEDPQSYGLVASADRSLSCEEEVIQQLVELQGKAAELVRQDGPHAPDEIFFAEQNARVAKNAESYYRAMYHGRPNTWNLRDQHMVETLELLVNHLTQNGRLPKAVVWAHNSHLGDARATQMRFRGELNIGQLIREAHPHETFSVGFTTYTGTVTAASDWGAVIERKRVRPALEESYEALFHETQIGDFMLPSLRIESLPAPRLERAIGVIYRPDTERWSHYFDAWLPDQFDALIHFDETRAVEPLDRTAPWEQRELPETYPSGL